MFAQSILLGSLATIASAANLNVQVSDNNAALVFTPDTTTAKVGDTITFHFYPKNHNVVQGSLAAPCAPLKDGFFSGFISSAAGEANKTFAITVKDDKPIWFYCSQGKHCNAGMAGVINPSSGSTIKDYVKVAANATIVTPTVVVGSGGTFGAPGSHSNLTATSPAGSAASSSAGSSASSSGSAATATSSKAGTSATGSDTSSASSATATAVKSAGEMFQIPGALALAAGFVALL